MKNPVQSAVPMSHIAAVVRFPSGGIGEDAGSFVSTAADSSARPGSPGGVGSDIEDSSGDGGPPRISARAADAGPQPHKI
ncbi:hypothetical protein GALLR39Z86_39870 [Glycomyces algeriensis]|uniref:Uncharacterized protein n=1 Tax=Glycomyces algeriensis TaxID=256037 RepID=A0A9W6GC58_9ACTN|nr:hypothetical protein GALLR39Z86_39870 [Glycomyces algeriensis]